MASVASDKGPVATDGSHASPPGPPTPAFSPDPSALAAAIDPELDDGTLEAARSVTKRPRSPSPGPSSVTADASALDMSPKKLARLASGSRFSDGATDLSGNTAAQEDERVFHEQVQDASEALMQADSADDYAAQTALSVLRGAEALLSQRAASEAAEVANEAAAALAAVTAGENGSTGDADIAAAQIHSDAAAAASAAAALAAAASVSSVDVDAVGGAADGAEHMAMDAQDHRSSALYQAAIASASSGVVDGHGLPNQMTIQDLAPKSPNSKRHKCPYCETEFTRHHNLKSHLLTHSQEKPYICTGCDMRFRRLHDLKRHSKLHTGEKPHICPRCDRKFARGDALARHSKGAGGCAGRRSSSSAFGGGSLDDSFDASGMADGDSSVMTGIEYDNVDDEERRRLSISAVKPQLGRGPRTSDAFATPSRSYSSLADGQRGSSVTGGLYPPNVDRAGVSATSGLANSTAPAGGHMSNTSSSSLPINAGSGALFSHGIAESPKQLSPAAGPDPQSSAQFRRLESVSPHGLAAASLQHIRPGCSTNGDTSANIFTSEQGMWSYVQTLENKLKVQEERLKQQDERIALLEASKLNYEAQISSLTRGLRQPTENGSAQLDPALESAEAATLQDGNVKADDEPDLEQTGEEQEQDSGQPSEQSPELLSEQSVDHHASQQAKRQAEQLAEQHAERQLEQHIGQQLQSAVAQQ